MAAVVAAQYPALGGFAGVAVEVGRCAVERFGEAGDGGRVGSGGAGFDGVKFGEGESGAVGQGAPVGAAGVAVTA